MNLKKKKKARKIVHKTCNKFDLMLILQRIIIIKIGNDKITLAV